MISLRAVVRFVFASSILVVATTTIFPATDEVEVHIKTPRLISFSSSWFYFFGGFAPQFSFQKQDTKQKNGQLIQLGLGTFPVPTQNSSSTSADLRLEYRRVEGEWDSASKESLDSFLLLIGPRFFSDGGPLKYTIAALLGVDWANSSDDSKFFVEVALSGGIGFALGKDSRLLLEAEYHPFSKKVGELELKPFASLGLRWLIFLPAREAWTTRY